MSDRRYWQGFVALELIENTLGVDGDDSIKLDIIKKIIETYKNLSHEETQVDG